MDNSPEHASPQSRPSDPVRTRFARVVSLIVAAVTAAPGPARAELEPTIETHTGPWYAPGAPEVASLWHPGDAGPPLVLRGRVRDRGEAPVAGALIELWHTDVAGNYPPLRASRRSDARGEFSIRTVLPGHHLGYRARHIHFVVTHPAHPRLVTRIYFKGDPNMGEALFPELAVLLEEGEVEGRRTYFGNVEFVLDAR